MSEKTLLTVIAGCLLFICLCLAVPPVADFAKSVSAARAHQTSVEDECKENGHEGGMGCGMALYYDPNRRKQESDRVYKANCIRPEYSWLFEGHSKRGFKFMEDYCSEYRRSAGA